MVDDNFERDLFFSYLSLFLLRTGGRIFELGAGVISYIMIRVEVSFHSKVHFVMTDKRIESVLRMIFDLVSVYYLVIGARGFELKPAG